MGPGGHFSSNITKATADGNCCCTSDVGRRYGGVLEFPPLKWKMKSQLIRGTQTTKISWFKNIVLKKFCLHFYSTPQNQFAPQTREQTFGGTFLWYEKLILGCWLWVGLGCGKKGLGRLWATFEGGFFNFLWANKNKNKFFENIVASALKSCIEKRLKKNLGGRISEKLVFLGLKMQ